ncbi:MAG: polyhydroxyalkanoic acid system family protein [Acidobacteriota bacterium]
MELTFATAATSMDQLRAALDAALQKQFPGGMLQRRWDGDVLRLSGPGADGRVVLENGQLVGRADLKPPASMMRPVIEEKMSTALRAAAESMPAA